jgi:hypothetical protein
MNDKIVEQ